MTTETPYSDNFKILIALVTQLASVDFKGYQGRSSKVITANLGSGFSIEQVEAVLNQFPELFRKGEKDAYNLHLRWARGKNDDQGEYQTPPLNGEDLSILLQIISQMVEHEKQFSKLSIEQKSAMDMLLLDIDQREITSLRTLRAARIAVIASVIAAVLSAIAALLSAFLKGAH